MYLQQTVFLSKENLGCHICLWELIVNALPTATLVSQLGNLFVFLYEREPLPNAAIPKNRQQFLQASSYLSLKSCTGRYKYR